MEHKTKKRQAVELAYEKGYRVTEDGRLIGLKGREMSVGPYGNHYYPCFTVNGVSFTKSGVKSIHVHHFAAYCFYGERMFDEGMRVRHLNDDPSDFSKKNIALGTEKENKMDIPLRKRTEMASKLYSYDGANEARTLHKRGLTYKQISEQTGISYHSVWDMVNMRSWRLEEE